MVNDKTKNDSHEGDQQLDDVSEWEKYEFICDLVKDRNTAEFDRSNNLDKKASMIIGFVGIIISLLGSIISLVLEKLCKNQECICQTQAMASYYGSFRILLLLGILCLAASILCSLIAYMGKPYTIVPNQKKLIETYAKDDDVDCVTTLIDVVNAMSASIDSNQSINDEKAIWINNSQIAFGLGMGFVILFICGLILI